jgi:hypothetical protein
LVSRPLLEGEDAAAGDEFLVRIRGARAQFQVAATARSPSRGHYIGYEISSMMSIGFAEALSEVSYDSHANAGHT